MFKFPSIEMIEELRKEFPIGCRIELVCMDAPYSKLEIGDKGTVKHVDDAGNIHINWDKGSSLSIVYGVDSCKKIDIEDIAKE